MQKPSEHRELALALVAVQELAEPIGSHKLHKLLKPVPTVMDDLQDDSQGPRSYYTLVRSSGCRKFSVRISVPRIGLSVSPV